MKRYFDDYTLSRIEHVLGGDASPKTLFDLAVTVATGDPNLTYEFAEYLRVTDRGHRVEVVYGQPRWEAKSRDDWSAYIVLRIEHIYEELQHGLKVRREKGERAECAQQATSMLGKVTEEKRVLNAIERYIMDDAPAPVELSEIAERQPHVNGIGPKGWAIIEKALVA
jgi:hypothetical protein|tara:strand:+ start:290 stop:793 length:504 start_codon:yes stop_codon:yes gene_type:complete